MSSVEKPLRVQAPAKVNLFLEVLGCRDNGYHDLRSIVAPLSLHDTVDLWHDETIVTEVEGAEQAVAGRLPDSDGNLATRAARALQAHTGYRGGARIRIHKRIPIGGGLGGGSADAAAVLAGLNRLWGTGCSREDLMELGSGLGCDIPALLHGGVVMMEGLGERVSPLSLGPAPSPDGRWWGVLANPGFSVSTADIYGRYRPLTSPRVPATSIVSALKDGEVDAVAEGLFNSLERTVVGKYPLIGILVDQLRRAGALGALVSGSGASVFGLASDGEHARALAERMVSTLDGSVWSRAVTVVPDGVMAAHGPLEA